MEDYVQDFDGEKVDEKTILERKVMEGKELSVDDRLIIIRALEKAGGSVFNSGSNQSLTIGNGYGNGSWWDANKITWDANKLTCKSPIQPSVVTTCSSNNAPATDITVYSTNSKAVED